MQSRMRFVALGLVLLAPASALGWGFEVHRLVNRAATTHLPPAFAGFAQWADSLEQLSVAADVRRCCDEAEAIRHYIDIDDYDEFFLGTLPQAYVDMVARYGRERVEGNGIVPWAIEATLAELTLQLRARDWARAVAAAADLGHYVADSHQPLHLTRNYDGQLSGQRGIHARYESALMEIHLRELAPAPGRVSAYARPLDAVFEWIEAVYPGVSVVLDADLVARIESGGSTASQVYYDVLWRETGALTQRWVQDASLAVVALWFTAWLDAGAPALPGDPPAAPSAPGLRLLPNEPNPFRATTTLRFEVPKPGRATLRVFDVRGRLVRTLLDEDPGRGERSLVWDGRDAQGRPVGAGAYRLRLEHGSLAVQRGAVLVHE